MTGHPLEGRCGSPGRRPRAMGRRLRHLPFPSLDPTTADHARLAGRPDAKRHADGALRPWFLVAV